MITIPFIHGGVMTQEEFERLPEMWLVTMEDGVPQVISVRAESLGKDLEDHLWAAYVLHTEGRVWYADNDVIEGEKIFHDRKDAYQKALENLDHNLSFHQRCVLKHEQRRKEIIQDMEGD